MTPPRPRHNLLAKIVRLGFSAVKTLFTALPAFGLVWDEAWRGMMGNHCRQVKFAARDGADQGNLLDVLRLGRLVAIGTLVFGLGLTCPAVASNDGQFSGSADSANARLRIQRMDVPPSKPVVTKNRALISPADLVGDYRHTPENPEWFNDAHIGSISLKHGSTTLLEWRNKGGWILNLEPDLDNDRLKTDESNPYYHLHETYNLGLDVARNFRLEYQNGKLIGFRFLNDLFIREGISHKVVRPIRSAFFGHFAFYPAEISSEHGYGQSHYVAIWPLLERPIDNFQVGLPGTWMVPDNRGYTQALLPPDNWIRKAAPEAGPTWDGLFQTIEGSPGYWGGTQFFTVNGNGTVPKYWMGPNPEGYENSPNTPGFGFVLGNPGPLPRSVMALAQLSNRLLVPADGFTFHASAGGEFLGVAWMALPLTDAKVASNIPIGDKSWTFFINAANYRGPVAFVVPDAWTRISVNWSPAIGRGFDARPMVVNQASMELNTVPGFESDDDAGSKYIRIPRLRFPTNSDGVTYLWSDWTMYSRDALFSPMQAWFSGTSPPISGRFDRMHALRQRLIVNEEFIVHKDWESTIPAKGLSNFFKGITLPIGTDGTAFGLRWSTAGIPGVLPEYYRVEGDRMIPVLESAVPEETLLHQMSFSEPVRERPYTSPQGGVGGWDMPEPASGPHYANLNDGSTITYYWYRFIDQPSLSDLPWSADDRRKLQSRVEMIHREWANSPEFMAPPSAGALVTLDEVLVVSPPLGLEVGYVPFTTQQAKSPALSGIAPVIISQPADILSSPGATAIFSVDVNGDGPFEYQWRKNFASIPGAAGPKYIIDKVAGYDAGYYSVAVRNESGVVTSASAVLAIQVKVPVITAHPVNISANAGSLATFSVGATGDSPLSYQWHKNGLAVAGATASTYSLAAVSGADAGLYSVVVSNSAGSVTSSTATLTVLAVSLSPSVGGAARPSGGGAPSLWMLAAVSTLLVWRLIGQSMSRKAR